MPLMRMLAGLPPSSDRTCTVSPSITYVTMPSQGALPVVRTVAVEMLETAISVTASPARIFLTRIILLLIS